MSLCGKIIFITKDVVSHIGIKQVKLEHTVCHYTVYGYVDLFACIMQLSNQSIMWK